MYNSIIYLCSCVCVFVYVMILQRYCSIEHLLYLCPTPEVEGHIDFGAHPVCVGVSGDVTASRELVISRTSCKRVHI